MSRDVSDRQLSLLATGSTDTIRNIRRGSSPRTDTLEAICKVLGVEIHLGPSRDDAEASPTTGREKDPPPLVPDPKPPEAPVPPEIREVLGLAEGATLRDAVQAIERRLSGEAWHDEIVRALKSETRERCATRSGRSSHGTPGCRRSHG